MKICADEHVAISIVKIVSEACPSQSEFLHVENIKATGVPDEIWVRQFAKIGGEGIVSADAAMLRRANEIYAIGDAGLKLIVLPAEYANSPKHLQMAFLLMWWPKILELFNSAKKAHYLKLPWNVRFPDKLNWEKFDLTIARKKANKANRPNRQTKKLN